MISHIIQNGGYILLIFFLCMIKTNSVTEEHTFAVQEFCSGNEFFHNIESGSPYVLKLKSGSSSNINKWFHKSKRKCRKQFRTSDSAAHFEVAITNMSIPSCESCRCSHFEIFSAYGHNKRFCGYRDDSFLSKTDELTIDFHPQLSQPFDVTFIFTVKRNFYIITGASTDSSFYNSYIETPYFPISYPPNYSADYLLQCDTNRSVKLLFLDFQISQQSFIEVTGNNSTHPTRYYGHEFRPSVIVSQSNILSLKFESNTQAGMPGFRAEFSCIKSKDLLSVPYTDCGGPKLGRDGLLNIKTHERFALYDCVWLIRPSLTSSKKYLSVLIQLRYIGHKSNLMFRKGRNSESEMVKDIDCEQNCSSIDDEIVVPASDDLYIRFSGYLDEYSVVNMSYSTYHMGNCSNKEFRCSDNRCILSDFRCDGIKQCPDGLDEDTCPSSEVSENEVPNHPSVQPKISVSSSMQQTFFILVLFGLLGLVVVLGIFFLVAIHCKKNRAAEQFLPQSVAELSDVSSTIYGHQYPVNSCDNPPSYEDYIKSSDNYPPILFTRSSQRSVPKCTQCTTSFCTGARVRHYSDSFNIKSSNDDSDIFLNIKGENSNPTQSSPGSSECNIEINQNITFKPSNNLFKRSYSLDSKLNDHVNKNCCSNFSFSVTHHPVCVHMSRHNQDVQSCTLPPNFKVNVFNNGNKEPKMNKEAFLHMDSSVNFFKDRRLTWSVGAHGSIGSEIVTVLKTRCFSDPCNGISVHCSLYQ